MSHVPILTVLRALCLRLLSFRQLADPVQSFSLLLTNKDTERERRRASILGTELQSWPKLARLHFRSQLLPIKCDPLPPISMLGCHYALKQNARTFGYHLNPALNQGEGRILFVIRYLKTSGRHANISSECQGVLATIVN